MALFAFPKSLMLFYGLTTDNVAIFGSHRKSWLLISTLVNIIVVSISCIGKERLQDGVTILFIIQSVSVGYVDSIVDGLIVQASRRVGDYGVDNGAEMFQTLNLTLQGAGAIAGGLVSSFLLKTDKIEPMQFLTIYVGLAVLLLIAIVFLGPDAEP